MRYTDSLWQAQFAESNRLEAEAIDRYLEMMPLAWHIRVTRKSRPIIEAGNRVARRYRLQEQNKE